jgi:hypothetical protein
VILSIILALGGYTLVYIGMAFMSGRILTFVPPGWWRVLVAQATVFLGANSLFTRLFIRERPMLAGVLTLCANVVCMIAATCLMEWRAPTIPMFVGTSMAMAGGLIFIVWK